MASEHINLAGEAAARLQSEQADTIFSVGDVRWNGMFKRPLTPSAARDMADRVVRRRKNGVPCFCPPEMAKKRILGGGPTSMLGRGNTPRVIMGFYSIVNSIHQKVGR